MYIIFLGNKHLLSNMGFNSALLHRLLQTLRSLAIIEDLKRKQKPEKKPLLSHIYFVVTEVTSMQCRGILNCIAWKIVTVQLLLFGLIQSTLYFYFLVSNVDMYQRLLVHSIFLFSFFSPSLLLFPPNQKAQGKVRHQTMQT